MYWLLAGPEDRLIYPNGIKYKELLGLGWAGLACPLGWEFNETNPTEIQFGHELNENTLKLIADISFDVIFVEFMYI